MDTCVFASTELLSFRLTRFLIEHHCTRATAFTGHKTVGHKTNTHVHESLPRQRTASVPKVPCLLTFSRLAILLNQGTGDYTWRKKGYFLTISRSAILPNQGTGDCIWRKKGALSSSGRLTCCKGRTGTLRWERACLQRQGTSRE